MIDAARKADYEINKEMSKRIEIKPNYFFIEKIRESYLSLENVINRNNLAGQNVNLINGDFNLCLHEIILHIKKRNPKGGGGSIFFLDQTGYSAVNIATLNLIRKELPKAEIIINISISWLIDFINDSGQFKKTISSMGIANFVKFR